VTKNQRQHRITELLNSSVISTAAQLVALLQAEGISATQATVTRDLQELGSVKIRNDDGVRQLTLATSPVHSPGVSEHLRRMMGEWALTVELSSNIVVIRTPPGCAHVVASALDRSALGGVLGCVAGDDTIIVIASFERGGASLAKELRAMAGFSSSNKKKGM
jgi:transcriptional regulator of arginine metabolism